MRHIDPATVQAWQTIMGLADWEIVAQISDAKRVRNNTGEVRIQFEYKRAIITLHANTIASSKFAGDTIESTLLHEPGEVLSYECAAQVITDAEIDSDDNMKLRDIYADAIARAILKATGRTTCWQRKS